MKSTALKTYIENSKVNVEDVLKAKFWGNVVKTNSCWFLKSKQKLYPRIHLSRTVYVRASKIALLISHGGYLCDGVWALHSCDNPSCVNPDHIFPGDPSLNMADKCKKNRQAKGEQITRNKKTPKGEEVKTSKLKYEDVLRIRKISANDHVEIRSLAAELDVCTRTIKNVIHNRFWKSLNPIET